MMKLKREKKWGHISQDYHPSLHHSLHHSDEEPAWQKGVRLERILAKRSHDRNIAH